MKQEKCGRLDITSVNIATSEEEEDKQGTTRKLAR